LEGAAGLTVNGAGLGAAAGRGVIMFCKSPVRKNSLRYRSMACRLTPNCVAMLCEVLPSFKNCSTNSGRQLLFLPYFLFLVSYFHTSMMLIYCQAIILLFSCKTRFNIIHNVQGNSILWGCISFNFFYLAVWPEALYTGKHFLLFPGLSVPVS